MTSVDSDLVNSAIVFEHAPDFSLLDVERKISDVYGIGNDSYEGRFKFAIRARCDRL